MKKLLLLLMALTLFAPPRANAQETGEAVTQHLNSGATNYGYLGMKGTGTSTSLTQNNYQSDGLNGAHNEGSHTIASFLTTKPSVNNGYGQGGFMYGQFLGTTADRRQNVVALQTLANFTTGETKVVGADKFQLIFQTKTPGTGVYYRPTTSNEIVIPEGTKLHFRTLGGKIQQIKIHVYHGNIYDTDEYGRIEESTGWISEQAEINYDKLTGFVFIKPKSEDCTELSVDLGENKQWVFQEINFDWFPLRQAELPIPDDITKIEVNGKEYVADAEGVINVPVEDKIFIKVPLPKGASNVFSSTPSTVLTTKPDPESTLTTQEHTGAFNFNSSATQRYGVTSLSGLPN